MSNKMFNRNKAITSIVKGELGSDRSRRAVNDDLKGDGIKPEWFKSPPKKEGLAGHVIFFEDTKKAVFMGFPADVRKLLNMPTKEVPTGNGVGQSGIVKLPDDGSGKTKYEPSAWGTRKYWQQQVSTKMGQFKTSYEKYLGVDKSKGADQNKTDDFTKLLELAVTSDKKLAKIEDAKFDVIEAKEALAKYITILNTKI
tara:strand:- start:24 stop:617 length:594 start_codon:yes stop_codon:yes gene_type:complete